MTQPAYLSRFGQMHIDGTSHNMNYTIPTRTRASSQRTVRNTTDVSHSTPRSLFFSLVQCASKVANTSTSKIGFLPKRRVISNKLVIPAKKNVYTQYQLKCNFKFSAYIFFYRYLNLMSIYVLVYQYLN